MRTCYIQVFVKIKTHLFTQKWNVFLARNPITNGEHSIAFPLLPWPPSNTFHPQTSAVGLFLLFTHGFAMQTHVELSPWLGTAEGMYLVHPFMHLACTWIMLSSKPSSDTQTFGLSQSARSALIPPNCIQYIRSYISLSSMFIPVSYTHLTLPTKLEV